MKTKHLTTIAMACLLMVGALAFVVTNVQASQHQANLDASVTIECPIVLTTNGTALAFGLISAPTNGQMSFWTIPPTTGAKTHSGTGNSISFGPSSQGHFDIQGSKDARVTLTITDFSDGFLFLSDITMAIGTNVITPSTGGVYVVPLVDANCATIVTVSVGGTLEVSEGAGTGQHTATIALTANY